MLSTPYVHKNSRKLEKKSSSFYVRSHQISFPLETRFCQEIINFHASIPSIAQLVERRTVAAKLSSLGRWFESGSKEFIFIYLFTYFFILKFNLIYLFCCYCCCLFLLTGHTLRLISWVCQKRELLYLKTVYLHRVNCRLLQGNTRKKVLEQLAKSLQLLLEISATIRLAYN